MLRLTLPHLSLLVSPRRRSQWEADCRSPPTCVRLQVAGRDGLADNDDVAGGIDVLDFWIV
jgi:hypothetical protein